MRIILFTPPSARKILIGQKTMTARLWRAKPPKVGDLVAAQTGYAKTTRFAVLSILKVWRWDADAVLAELGEHPHLTDEIAKKEGFETKDEFCDAYFHLNKHNWDDPTRIHWFIEFEVIEEVINGKEKYILRHDRIG